MLNRAKSLEGTSLSRIAENTPFVTCTLTNTRLTNKRDIVNDIMVFQALHPAIAVLQREETSLRSIFSVRFRPKRLHGGFAGTVRW